MSADILTVPFETQDYTSVCHGDARINAYVTLPAAGVRPNTGGLLLLHGWGNDGEVAYREDSIVLADRYDLVVTRVEYRHSGKESRRKEPSYEVPYDCSKRQTIDCLRALGATLARWPGVRRDRLYVWGGSQGGYLGAQCMTWAPQTFALAVLACGLYHPSSRQDVLQNGYSRDVREADPAGPVGFEEYALGAGRAFPPGEREIRSPNLYADRVRRSARVVLLHGVDDQQVDVRHAVRYYAELRRAGVEAVFLPILKGDHQLMGAAPDEDTRLKATLKYVPDADWTRRTAGPIDFDYDHEVAIPTSAGVYRVCYERGVPSLRDP